MKQEDFAKLEDLYKQRAVLDQELKKFTKDVTVSFVDIVGSTTFFEQHGDVAGMIYVHKCIDMLSDVALKYAGTVCKTIGDAVMTSYEDPVKAVQGAIEMQRALDAYNETAPPDEQIRVRIGLNYGPGLIKDKDVFGDAVNVAARIEAAAKGEQIFISASLEKEIREAKIPAQKLPDLAAKGKAEKVSIYEVLWKQTKPGAAAQPARTPSPTVAGRTPVAEAAKPVGGTVVLNASAFADLLKKPLAQYSLVVVRPDGAHGQALRLEKPVNVLGRVDGDLVFPDDPLVSRRHAQFTVKEDGVVVEDLKSANGIFRRVREPQELTHGEIILMGRQMFRFHVPETDGGASPKEAKAAAAKGDKAGDGKGKAAPALAELIRILPGGIEENHYALTPGENVLGRTRGTINFPEDAYLSGQHARIKCADGKFVLEDMQAVNGTFVGIREPATLIDGDILLIGHQLLRVTQNPA